VQLDCFFVGRLLGSKGTVWQYTAADVASGFIWAELHSSERNPRARWTAELVHRVARELKAAGWKLGQVTTDNGSEFASREFGRAVEAERARQWRIKAGNPNSNGCVERAQLTILEECWRPAFARSLAPKITATWPNTSTSSTTTAPTTAASPKAACPQISSSAPARWEPRDEPELSQHLGVRTN
jgi:transposase InsO family protein